MDLLFESEVLLEAQSLDRERAVHQHIGDFTLFMAGLFPEYLRRLKQSAGCTTRIFWWTMSKRESAPTASWPQIADQPAQDHWPLFAKLSDNFELCVTGLGFVRSDLDRMQNPAYKQARDLLLN